MDLERRDFFKKASLTGIAITAVAALKFSFSSEKNDQNNTFNNATMVERQLFSMGTQGSIKIVTEDIGKAEAALDLAVQRLSYLESKLTKFTKYSDVGQININQGRPVYVSQDTLNVLKSSLDLIPKTNYRFDIGLGNFLHKKGLDAGVPIVGSKQDFKKIEIYDNPVTINDRYVTLTRKNTMLDLGGVAKGYALSEAMKVLKEQGMKHVAIDLGGDLMVLGGKGNHTPWVIGLDPKAQIQNNNKQIHLASSSLASSGGYFKKSADQSGKIKHHIVDPKTLSSVNHYKLTTVEGPSSLTCDVLATAAFNTPAGELDKLRKVFPEYKIYAFT